MIALSIPRFRKLKDKEYTVYEIHITKPNGREVTSEKRYSEFYDFNKQVGKFVHDHLHFPSKKLPKPLNTSSRFLESRREALEQYLRNLVSHIGITEVHDLLTQFLDTNLPQHVNLDSSRTSSLEELDGFQDEVPKLTHQALVCFINDPFKDNCDANPLPNIVLEGTLKGLYG
ncbi:hypothetical protein ACROYT_G026990 [Oculina patagonica]